MFEPVKRFKGFNLLPETYSYIIVSGDVKCYIPGSDAAEEDRKQRPSVILEEPANFNHPDFGFFSTG